MESSTLVLNMAQLALFGVSEVSTGVVELFPAVWNAAERLAAPELLERTAALDRLIELDAARFSPLVAYVLATRITEPDVALRVRVVKLLGELFSLDAEGHETPQAVRRYLSAHFAQMRTRSVYSLLEVSVFDSSAEEAIFRLLNANSFAGSHLVDIAADRAAPLLLRQQAVYYIGRVGYLDALPALERLAARLETRIGGQQAMPFLPQNTQDEGNLLPVIQKVLQALRK